MSGTACGIQDVAPGSGACGDASGLHASVVLRAGPLTAVLESGELRYVRFAGTEVVRRVFASVRDAAWGTVVPRVNRCEVAAPAPDAFRVGLQVRHSDGDIDFDWRGEVTGQSEGGADGRQRIAVRFEMDGVARKAFRTNRTGISVLQPIAGCVGSPCEVTKIDGARVVTWFPEHAAPHVLATNVRSLAYRVGRARVTIAFEGEAFEMEDQRNWCDGSFKTYGRPLSRPFPYELKAGERVRQAVAIVVEGADTGEDSEGAGDVAALSVGAPMAKVPAVGVSLSTGRRLLKGECDLVRAAGFGHLRADVSPDGVDFRTSIDAAAATARSVGLRLEVGLHLSSGTAEELDSLAAAWGSALPAPPVARWIVYEVGRPIPSRVVAEFASERLAALTPGVPVGVGTIGSFAEVNRHREGWGAGDALAFPLNPQVHGTDAATIVESLDAPACLVSTAKSVAPHAPVWVGPVTFHRRIDPFAAGNSGNVGDGPVQPDHRLQGALGAVWTVGCLAGVAGAGAEAVTAFDATGPFGITEGNVARPVYQVLRAMAEFTGGDVLACSGLRPLSLTAFALRKPGRLRLIVANLQEQPSRVRLALGETWSLLDHRCIAGDGTSSCTADELSMSAYGVSVIDFSERGGCHAQA